MMAPKLYIMEASPAVRAVLMVEKALNLRLDHIPVDLAKAEHLKPEYITINPQHTVPTLEDNGFSIWDSHAIIPYLIRTYAKDSLLLPKDIQQLAIVEQRLHFDSSVLFPQVAKLVHDKMDGKDTIDQKDRDHVNDVYGFLEKFLENKKWMAGNVITVADYALIASTSSLNALLPINRDIFPKLIAWMNQVEGLPAYEANKKGLEEFIGLFKY